MEIKEDCFNRNPTTTGHRPRDCSLANVRSGRISENANIPCRSIHYQLQMDGIFAFKIIVKPNSSRNEILGYDNERGAYRVSIKAKPEDNKANIEVIKFFSKLSGKKARILSGLRSKQKLIRIE